MRASRNAMKLVPLAFVIVASGIVGSPGVFASTGGGSPVAPAFAAVDSGAGSAVTPGTRASAPEDAPLHAVERPDTSRGEGATDSREEVKREMERIGQAEVPGQREWERRKSPRVAMVSSMILPGLGQLYNGRRIKTMLAVGAFTYYLGTAWFEEKDAQRSKKARDAYDPGSFDWRTEDAWYQFHKQNSQDFLWWSGAVWLISVLDAFVDAHLYDVRSVKPAVVRADGHATYVGLSMDF
jgi:hypothetical protein